MLQCLKLENFTRAISEIHRVLKKDGRAVITFPFYYKDHQDNLRVTKKYIIEILNNLNFREYKVQKIGNKHTAVFDILRYSFWDRITDAGRIKKSFYSLYYLPRLMLKFIIIKIFNLEKIKDDFYSGLFIILKK